MNKKYNTTFIISSHDTYEILEMANRIIIMNNGSIVVDDEKSNILEKHNNFSWNYFNIGTILKSRLVKIKDNEIICQLIPEKNKYHEDIFKDIKERSINLHNDLNIQPTNFTCIDLDKCNNVIGVPKIGKTVLLYIDPRSKISLSSNKTNKYILVRIIDFIFYYQNIFVYNDTFIQINTTYKLDINCDYTVDIHYSLISIID